MNLLPTPILRLTDIRRSYNIGTEVETEVLHGISIALQQAEFVALRGPSGSGKSTLLNIIGLLERPTSGTLEIAGQQTTALDDAGLTQLRGATIGFVFQFHHLLPDFNAVENAAMPAIIAGEARPQALDRARQMLDRVGLLHRADYNVTLLSGGERQRVALARAVLQNPAVILADEPTGNLDENTGRRVADLLLELNDVQKTALVVVTHNPELAARMERRLELKSGELYEQPR